MLGHVWHHARVELRGCGKRAAVVAITDSARREHVGNDVELGHSPRREMRLSIFDVWWADATFCRVSCPQPSVFGSSSFV